MARADPFPGRRQIKCSQQLAFLKFWERHRGPAGIPCLPALVNEDVRRVFDKLMLCEVVREEDRVRFLTRLHGCQFEKVHGTQLHGCYVDETVPEALREDALRRYHDVVTTALPNFGAVLLRAENGPIVRYERLLLPFSRTESRVDFVCCLVTMVTEENGFDFDVAIKGRVYDSADDGIVAPV